MTENIEMGISLASSSFLDMVFHSFFLDVFGFVVCLVIKEMPAGIILCVQFIDIIAGGQNMPTEGFGKCFLT